MEPFNAERGELLLKVSDQEYILEPSFERVVKLETVLGRPMLQVTVELVQTQKLSVSDIANIILCMARSPKDLTFNGVGQYVMKEGITKCMAKLGPFFKSVLAGMTNEKNEDAGGSSQQPAVS